MILVYLSVCASAEWRHVGRVGERKTSFLLPTLTSPTITSALVSINMASDSKDSAFSILGSSKLNTADGKNPTSSATTSTSTQPGTASGQKNSEEYKKECSKAHDALEDRLRDEGLKLHLLSQGSKN